LTTRKVAEEYQTYKSIKKPKLWLRYPNQTAYFRILWRHEIHIELKIDADIEGGAECDNLMKGRKCRSAGCMYVIVT